MYTLFEAPPLQRYQLFQTRDVKAVHPSMADILCPHKIIVSASGKQTRDALLHYALLPNGAMAYLVYGAEVQVDVSQLGFFLVELPLSGTSTNYYGDVRVPSAPGQAVVSGPYQKFSTKWTSDCSKLLIKIESNALENYLSSLLGRRQIQVLDFDMEMNLTANTCASFLRTVQWVVDDIEQSGSLINTAPQAGLRYQRMLMWALLHCQPNNYSNELAAKKEPQIPSYILDVERYIRRNYRQAMSLKQLVEHANVSERTLLQGFKRFRDVSPMRLLKLTRLDIVHLALKEADDATTNVTEIALANGFSQLGKFATEYKERFGESPSQTLHRLGNKLKSASHST
ncbi:AraC family transcriptional regulator [Kineobactrum salinum]|uniref:AraC family transcriptional regulator n=1 Tax=Kineobactrum salinum TaxID=2708301 RepID=A0A6C0U491_9GAMM|nr:AraC family transcriptional regulator [Kineobactrum salinum]QIB64264.1 AraC family transcriptional regulator [Kineobactrum salinum]